MRAVTSPRLVERAARALTMANASAVPIADVPWYDLDAFQQHVIDATRRGRRVAALVAYPHDKSDERRARSSAEGGATLRVLAAIADDEAGTLELVRTDLEGPNFPALTPRCPQVHLFERELAEQWGVIPEGH